MDYLNSFFDPSIENSLLKEDGINVDIPMTAQAKFKSFPKIIHEFSVIQILYDSYVLCWDSLVKTIFNNSF